MKLHPDTLIFLQDLSANNNREWFMDNKPRFEVIQEQLILFSEKLLQHLAFFDERMLDIVPKKCLFRIYKDARYVKDGMPYKTHMGLHMVTSGNRADWGRAGFYVHIAPNGQSLLAGGAHAPTSEWLRAIREHIAEKGDVLSEIVQNKAFKQTFGSVQGEKLSRNPQGFDANHPQMQWLKYKTLTVSTSLTDKEVMSDQFIVKAAKIFGIYLPFRDFLNLEYPPSAFKKA